MYIKIVSYYAIHQVKPICTLNNLCLDPILVGLILTKRHMYEHMHYYMHCISENYFVDIHKIKKKKKRVLTLKRT